MRRTVGAEEESCIAGGHGIQQGHAVALALQYRQAVVMRADAASEQRIAVQRQMLRSDGCRDALLLRADEFHRGTGGHMFEHDAQLWQPCAQRYEHIVDETCLAIEYVNLG